jgi:hypothetical protein
MLTASVVRVRHSAALSRIALTSHCRIQDSALVTRPADESRSPGFGQHHSAPYGPSPRRGLAGDVFHLSPVHRGTTHMEHEWYLLVDSPDPVRTQGFVQRESPHDHPASVSSWNNGIYVYGPPAVDKSPTSFGELTSPTDDGLSSWPQSVNAHGPFTSRPNLVSGGESFPQGGGPLMLPYSPYYAARSAPAIEPSHSNQPRLSSGSQGQSLISNPNYVRSEISAPWQYLTFGFLRIQ